MFENLNSFASTIREGIDLQSMPFVALKELTGQTVRVDGFFFTEGRYGKQVVVVGNGKKINMPSRAVEKFELIQNNEQMLKAVLDGHLMLTDIKEASTKNGSTTTFRYKDC